MYKDTEEIMKLLRSSILTKKKNIAIKGATLLTIILIFSYFFLYYNQIHHSSLFHAKVLSRSRFKKLPQTHR
jgi:hypothetical protein